jgi:hypothetical protein
MREQPCAGIRVRRVGAGSEHHVIPQRVGPRVDRARGFRCIGVGMDADATEIVAESRLHELSTRRIERSTGSTQGLHYRCRRRGVGIYVGTYFGCTIGARDPAAGSITWSATRFASCSSASST